MGGQAFHHSGRFFHGSGDLLDGGPSLVGRGYKDFGTLCDASDGAVGLFNRRCCFGGVGGEVLYFVTNLLNGCMDCGEVFGHSLERAGDLMGVLGDLV